MNSKRSNDFLKRNWNCAIFYNDGLDSDCPSWGSVMTWDMRKHIGLFQYPLTYFSTESKCPVMNKSELMNEMFFKISSNPACDIISHSGRYFDRNSWHELIN